MCADENYNVLLLYKTLRYLQRFTYALKDKDHGTISMLIMITRRKIGIPNMNIEYTIRSV